MRWAIDVGNTHTVFGLHDGRTWVRTWRRQTDPRATEDELWAFLHALGATGEAESAICGSVVPSANEAIARLCEIHLGVPARFLRTGADVGLRVTYDPPHAVGADRIANALGALALFEGPLVVVDFGTATTFDTVDGEGTYLGGAILPGPRLAAEALASGTAKLPQIEFVPPPAAIGRDTVTALQSGLVLGYAGAIDALARRISGELGEARVISTGGLGALFAPICETIESHHPELTLDGLLIASDRFAERTL